MKYPNNKNSQKRQETDIWWRLYTGVDGNGVGATTFDDGGMSIHLSLPQPYPSLS
jgi:hypothetical protein